MVLFNSWRDKGIHTFPKVNLIPRLEFKLAYNDVSVQYISHYTTRCSFLEFWVFIRLKLLFDFIGENICVSFYRCVCMYMCVCVCVCIKFLVWSRADVALSISPMSSNFTCKMKLQFRKQEVAGSLNWWVWRVLHSHKPVFPPKHFVRKV